MKLKPEGASRQVIGIPILVLVGFIVWLIWRATATLDDIEARQLAWGTIGEFFFNDIVIS